MTDYSSVLDEIESKLSVIQSPTPPSSPFASRLDQIEQSLSLPPAAPPAAPERPDFSQLTYSENDLTQDQFFPVIEEYMVDRFGQHIRKLDRADVVEKFTNNMRGFAGGNSVRALNEITYLNEVGEDEARLAKAGAAYELYEGMQGLLGETTVGEKAEVVGDFVRSAVLDPINVLSLGIGKAATGVGFKAGSQIAYIAAKQAYKRQLAKGATAEAANKVATRVFQAQTRRAVAETNKRIAQRQAVESAAKTTLERMTTGVALKQAAIVGGFEAAVSAGTDYLWQDAMLRTKVQEEYNTFQTGLSAVIGLVAGGLSGAASNVGTGVAGTVAPAPFKTGTKGSKAVAKLVNQAPVAPAGVAQAGTPSPAAGNWLADIAKGKELTDQDTEFFITMMLGNDEKGLKGLAQILLEDGYVWKKRNVDDKVSNWIGDIIKNSDPQDAKQFLDDFTAATGIDMVEGKQLTIEAFADTFKKKMSDSGKVLNAASQAAKLLGRKAEDITGEDYLQFVLSGITPPPTAPNIAVMQQQIGKTIGNLINRDLPDFQNNVIRLIVSNLSTTALNVTGYAAATTLNSATDVVRAILTGGSAGIMLAVDPKKAKDLGIDALSILRNQKQKVLNILDVNTTYDTFLKYAEVRPEAMRELTAVLPGGVESLAKLSRDFDPDKPLLTLKMNQAVDVIQRLNLVSAQDGYTKSIEFLTQMDGLLRRSRDKGGFGMSWNEFFSSPDYAKNMMSERFVRLEAKAVDETLKSVFSKSYKGSGILGEVAGVIEDARNLPFIGLLVPFGRFFNNTVAFANDILTVGPLLSKAVGGQVHRSAAEIAARGLVSSALVGALAMREMDYMQRGLGWSEEIDEETGEVLDERYEFPYSAYKALARLAAHRMSGTEIPAELSTQMGDQFFGQLTRQLGEAGGGIVSLAQALLSDEGPALGKVMADVLGAVPAQIISGATRTLEPINVMAGLARDEEFYVPDRKQGTKWLNNSLRYMDQMIALVKGENDLPELYSAAEGQPRVLASRLVSTTRATNLTSTEQVMNMIGRPTWKAGMSSQSEVADNRYNQVFHEFVEAGARNLMESKRFLDGDLETKQLLVNNLFESARKTTKAFMGRVAINSTDESLKKILDISNYGQLKVRRVMEDLGFDKSLDELSPEELDTLGTALKFREEYLTR